MQQQQLFQPLDEHAIEIVRTYAPKDGRAIHVAYSGGKDSQVLLDVVKRSGVLFSAWYQFCPLDPKELRAFIKEQQYDPANAINIALPEKSLITVARERGMMPMRNRRWCCEVIKERRNDAPLTLTGIRWAESARRRRRRIIESCSRAGGFLLHPIINWRDEDVWAYIHGRGLPYCSLYDEGYRRLGCVLCPMTRNTEQQIQRFPWAVKIWRAVSKACFETRQQRGHQIFNTEKEQWEWWLERDAKANPDGDDCPLFDGILEDGDTAEDQP